MLAGVKRRRTFRPLLSREMRKFYLQVPTLCSQDHTGPGRALLRSGCVGQCRGGL